MTRLQKKSHPPGHESKPNPTGRAIQAIDGVPAVELTQHLLELERRQLQLVLGGHTLHHGSLCSRKANW